jgi:Family of unknown function (DUF5947)
MTGTSGSGLRRFARPGQSEPGQSVAGQPEPGQSVAGQSEPGQPVTGQPAPGRLAPAVGAAGSPSGSAARPPTDLPLPGPLPVPLSGPADVEKCELCATEIPAEHGHVADLESSTLICACRACYLLFTQPTAGRGRYRAVPDRYLSDPGRTLTAAQWDQLEIPVGLAFFLQSSSGDRAGRVAGFYPSPAGVTECILDLAAWQQLTAEYPLLAAPAPDVEAALICRTDDAGVEYYLVPIDACYELAGRMRLYWRGFDGGAEARSSIAGFLDTVRARARPFRPESRAATDSTAASAAAGGAG